MTVETAADRAAFLADFGVAATYRTAQDNVSTALTVLFEGASDQFSLPGSDVPVTDAQITAMCVSAALPADAASDVNDTIEIAAVTYKVLEIRPDGTGMSLLALGR